MGPSGKGSFLYPEPAAFSGDVDEYIAFFESAEIADATLERASKAYAACYERAMAAARRAAEEAFDKDPEMIKWTRGIKGGVFVLEEFRRGREVFKPEVAERLDIEWVQPALKKEREQEWPGGPRLSPLNARVIVRAAQIIRMRGLLGSEEREEELMQRRVHFPLEGIDRSYDEIAHRWHTGRWVREALG